jgi:protein-disulfide isomerase
MKKLPIVAGIAIAALLAWGAALWSGEADPAQARQASSDPFSAEALRVRSQIQNDPVAPTVAPRGYDVTVVVFADYQCPYCRKLHPALEALVREDAKVKLVFRDWPVFGAASTEAARAAIASKWQGKHSAFNDALMTTTGKLTSKTIRAAADKAGVDWAKLQVDLTAHKTEIDGVLDRNSRYAAMLGLQGTPGMLIGPYLIPGGIDLDGLREAVSLARRDPNGTSP